MQCFGNVFEEEKTINVDAFDDVLQNAKHRQTMHIMMLIANSPRPLKLFWKSSLLEHDVFPGKRGAQEQEEDEMEQGKGWKGEGTMVPVVVVRQEGTLVNAKEGFGRRGEEEGVRFKKGGKWGEI